MRRATIWHALATLGALAFIVGCKSDEPGTPEAPAARVDGDQIVFRANSPQLQSLRLEAVTSRNGTAYRITGRTVWDEDHTVRVYTPFAGRIETIHAGIGAVVRTGESLATVSSPDFGQTQAELHKADADFALAERNLARQRELLEHGVAAVKDVQSAEADFQRASAELARVRSRAALYGGGNVDQRFPLRAPLGGVVVEKNINPGQEVRPDQMTSNAPALFVITDPTHLWVQLDAIERDLAVLKLGQAVALRTPTYPDETFAAHIDSIADFIDPATRVIRVRASVDNAQRRLKAEMFVTAEMRDDKGQTLMIPSSSVFLVGTKHYAFVDQGDGRFRRAEVAVGKETDGWVPASGVGPGQSVVASGALLLEQLFETGG